MAEGAAMPEQNLLSKAELPPEGPLGLGSGRPGAHAGRGRGMKYRFQHGDSPIEGYKILRGVGRGGFGEVYYAMSDGGREVALKVLLHNEEVELRGVRQCINLKSPH